MTEKFNVTLIQPPGYAHAHALGEVWTYLADVLQRAGYPARTSVNHLSLSEHNIVLCGHLLRGEQLSRLPANTIIFNSEKLEQRDGWYFAGGGYGTLLQNFTVWDYSARNIAFVPHARKAQIPLYHSPALRRAHPRNADGPLLFYGCMTERRAEILKSLQRAGVRIGVLKFGCYGEARDRAMFQSSAVLNLHTDAERTVFEPVRCFHPLINGIPVITEEFHDEPMFEIYRRAAFVVGDDPADAIATLLADPVAFQAEAARRCTAFASADPLPAVRSAVASYLDSGQTSAQPVALDA